MSTVVIGMDPHKHASTIEVMAADERVLGGGRFHTARAGYRVMVALARRWPERIWAIEGCQGIGGHLAARLIADSRQVLDVPPSCRYASACSRPGRAARPTPPMHTRLPWWRLG